MLINDRGKSKVYCDINRVCDIEDASVEWLEITERQIPTIEIPFKKFTLRFRVVNVQFNELDQHYSKIVLECMSRGVANKEQFKNLRVEIKAKG